MSDTGKTTIRLPDGLWDRFIEFVVNKHHRSHGGVLAKEAATALMAHMNGISSVVLEEVLELLEEVETSPNQGPLNVYGSVGYQWPGESSVYASKHEAVRMRFLSSSQEEE